MPNMNPMSTSTQDPAGTLGAASERGPTSSIFRSQFYRTRLCFFNSQGRCRYGARCAFAHSNVDLSVMPDLTKTSLCKDWKEGKCTKSAADCLFAHGKHEIRSTPQYATKQAKSKSGSTKKAPDKGSLSHLISSFGAPEEASTAKVQKALNHPMPHQHTAPSDIVGLATSFNVFPGAGLFAYTTNLEDMLAPEPWVSHAKAGTSMESIDTVSTAAPSPGPSDTISVMQPMKVDLSFLDGGWDDPLDSSTSGGNIDLMSNFEEYDDRSSGLLGPTETNGQSSNKACTLRLSRCLDLPWHG